jgi:hypothetical protein
MSEIDFDNLVETIFTRPLQPNNYYQLQFIEDLEISDVFEFLLMAFTSGSKILYGDASGKVSLNTWGVNEINELNARFNSFGFKCNILSFSTIEEYTHSGIKTYKEIMIKPSTHLNKLYFSIKCSNNGVIYVINFDLLL